MRNKNFLNRLHGYWLHYHPKLTRTWLALFAVTLIVVSFALGGLKSGPDDGAAVSTVVEIDLPQRDVFQPAQDDAFVPGQQDLPSAEDEPWQQVVVSSGQSLDSIFRNQGFSIGTLHQIVKHNEDTGQLTKIRPGDVFEFQRLDDQSFKRMRYAISDDRYLIVEHDGQQVSSHTVQRELVLQTTETSGVIQSSLFLAGKQAGLTDAMVMNLANLFGWDIDFVLDIREGDRFYLVYEKVYRDGKFLRDGEIVGATFVNQGEKFQALRYESDGRIQYFAPDGRNMRKAFLRAPLNFSYVSSNFNPKRYHPILKRVKAHNGIDYRAPKGTPVYAAGDGKVIQSAYSKYNGHHVFIQHANSIVTKYLTVKKGQRVKQGQVIGYVGSTGLAQAPHLHYEFLLNGVHRNPRTVSLPKADPLPGDQLAEFKQATGPVLTMLSRLESASAYALSP
jgi:murein DD-endopeptidase MepM/ murein hydrolase activator NlpD